MPTITIAGADLSAGDPEMHQSIGPRPMLICGAARSGTTLLSRLLDSHPELTVLPEETYLSHTLLTSRRLGRLLMYCSEMLHAPFLSSLMLRRPLRYVALADSAVLRSRLETWSQSLTGVAMSTEDIRDVTASDRLPNVRYWNAFLDAYDLVFPGALARSRYWVEKTPSNERYIAFTEQAFAGECRYLHVIRDPRDVAASWLERQRSTPVNRAHILARVCYFWSLSVKMCCWGLKALPDRYFAFRYEDLASRTADVMQGIACFAGIAMHDSLLSPTRLGVPVPLNTSYPAMSAAVGVVPAQIGRFTDFLGGDEIALLESLLGEQMRACGYLPTRRRAGLPVAGTARITGADHAACHEWLWTYHARRQQHYFRGRQLPLYLP